MYLCEKCGKDKLTLQEYLSVDITKKAKCKDCKNKR